MTLTPGLELAIKLVLLAGMLLGLITLVIPVIPGVTIIWGLALLYGIVFGFASPGGWLFAAITVLAVIGMLIDNIIAGGKARASGARWTSIGVALLAGLIGSLALSPFLGIPLALLALFLAEGAYRHNLQEAWQVTLQMLIGWGWAVIARIAIGLTMIALWAIWAW